jgi:hypothetical protein
MTREILIAIALITSDRVPEGPLTVSVAALKAAAVHLELMNADLSYTPELRTLRYRYTQVHDAPRVVHANAFPDSKACTDGYQTAHQHAHWIEQRMLLFPAEATYWSAKLIEQRRRVAIWSAADDLYRSSDAYYRRMVLLNLYRLLGPADFYAGRLPPPVLIEHFRRLP